MMKKYPDVLKIKDMCEVLGGISTKTGYKLLRENKIENIKVGREYCITKISVVDFLMRKNIIINNTNFTASIYLRKKKRLLKKLFDFLSGLTKKER